MPVELIYKTKTSLTQTIFIEVSIPRQESEWSRVSGISFTSVWDFDILFWNSFDSALFFAFNHSIIIMCNIWLRII
jgi:hypothetical protein